MLGHNSDQYNYLNNVAVRPELLGMPNIMSSFPQMISAPRASMFNHHVSQAMTLNNPQFNKIFSGFERNFIDYRFDGSIREHDCEVIAIIPKYSPTLVHQDLCPTIYVIVMNHLPNGKRELDYFTIDRYFLGTNGFGYIPILENRRLIRPGTVIAKDETITHSPSVQGNQYALGTNLNVIYGSFPETIEDAFIISESGAKQLSTTQVQQIAINCRQDKRPVNINGDEYSNKFLPDIGGTVRDDGLLCAFRPVHWTTAVADSDPHTLRQYLPLQDDPIYVEPGAKIVDLTFHINRSRAKLNDCYEQAHRYVQSGVRCWMDIYKTSKLIKVPHTLSPKMSTLLNTAIYHMVANESIVPSLEEDFRKVIKKSEIKGLNGSPVDFIQAIVTYTIPREIKPGSKLTDFNGAKGVVAYVYPDEWMPVDEYGIRADLWIDMNSPVSRTNPPQLYESGINRIAEFVRGKVKVIYETQGSDPAFEILMEFYHDVNFNYAKLVREGCKNSRDKQRVVVDAIENSPRVWIPAFLNTLLPSKEDTWNALVNIRNWAAKWDVRSTPVTYKTMQKDGTGKEFTTIAKFAIGSKYIIHLHKIPDITAPGPASVNHLGIPVKSPFDSKYFPVSTNPYRFGEDELRVMSMDSDVREVVRFQALMANSPVGTNIAIRTILTTEHPTRIKRIPISNGELAKTNTVLNLTHTIAASLGIETKHTLTDQYDVPDELSDAVWTAEIVDPNASRMEGISDPSSKRKKGGVKLVEETEDTTTDDEDTEDA